MIVATRLSAVWQVAGVAAAALCCYLVSQSVASERAQLLRVDRQIADTRNQIGSLQMEIGVRARMGQLESWNRDVLALQAPRPAQFVGSGLQLASLYGRKGAPALQLDPAVAPPHGPTTLVAYQAPAPAAAAPVRPAAPAPEVPLAIDPPAPQPMLRTAAYVRPVDVRLGAQSVAVQKVSYQVDTGRSVSPALVPSSVAPKVSSVQPAEHKSSPRSLLPADIADLAARETKGAKRR